MKEIHFHQLAKQEFLDVIDHYDELVFGLGKSFVAESENCLNVILTNPRAYPVIKDNIRKAVVLKFPYSILYRLEKENIYVLAVMHQKRKPLYWANRK